MSQQSSNTLSELVGEANALLFENAESIPNGLYLQLMNLTGKMYPKVTKMEEEIQYQKTCVAELKEQLQGWARNAHKWLPAAAPAPAPAPAPAAVRQRRICKRCCECGERLTASDIAASWNEESRQEWQNNTDYNYRYIYIIWRCGSCL